MNNTLSNICFLNITIDAASFILSILAGIFSIISLIFTYKQSNKHNSLNLESRYFEKIFDTYLITKIPQSRKYIRYDHTTNKLVDINKMIDVLGYMKNDSLYFKYSNPDFYKDLVDLILNLEDFICECSNYAQVDTDKQAKNILEIGSKIEGIYSYINKHSLGE